MKKNEKNYQLCNPYIRSLEGAKDARYHYSSCVPLYDNHNNKIIIMTSISLNIYIYISWIYV